MSRMIEAFARVYELSANDLTVVGCRNNIELTAKNGSKFGYSFVTIILALVERKNANEYKLLYKDIDLLRIEELTDE